MFYTRILYSENANRIMLDIAQASLKGLNGIIIKWFFLQKVILRGG